VEKAAIVLQALQLRDSPIMLTLDGILVAEDSEST